MPARILIADDMLSMRMLLKTILRGHDVIVEEATNGREAVEKAKADLRAELRQELQAAQATAEFAGASAPGPKFEFLEVDGYFRLRGELKDRYDLHRGADNAGTGSPQTITVTRNAPHDAVQLTLPNGSRIHSSATATLRGPPGLPS